MIPPIGPVLPADFLYAADNAQDAAFVAALAQSLHEELRPSHAGWTQEIIRNTDAWAYHIQFRHPKHPHLGYRLAFSPDEVQVSGGIFQATEPEQEAIRQHLWAEASTWQSWELSREWFKCLGDLIPVYPESPAIVWQDRAQTWPSLAYRAWYWEKAYLLKSYRGQEGLHEYVMQFFRLLSGPVYFIADTLG